MGLFRRRNDEALAALRAELQQMHAQLDRAEQTNAELHERVGEIDRRNGELAEQVSTIDELRAAIADEDEHTDVPPLPPPTNPMDVIGERMEQIEERLAGLDERSDRIDGRLEEVGEQTAKLDERVTNTATELANQLTELSSDLDYVAQGLPPGGATAPIDPEMIAAKIRQQMDEEIDAKLGVELEEVRTSAERLAMEQARYEIQFRRDLAELADRLRRPRGG